MSHFFTLYGGSEDPLQLNAFAATIFVHGTSFGWQADFVAGLEWMKANEELQNFCWGFLIFQQP